MNAGWLAFIIAIAVALGVFETRRPGKSTNPDKNPDQNPDQNPDSSTPDDQPAK